MVHVSNDLQSDGTSGTTPPRRPLEDLITRLDAGYGRLPPALAPPERDRTLAALRLATAALRDLAALDEQVPRPLQVAVLGPTQAGKSTVVNLLLGQSMAAASPLAGFTVHPAGFGIALRNSQLDWLRPLFPDWTRHDRAALSRDQLDAYALDTLAATAGLPDDTVLWDTPDFDSLKAHDYQRGVLDVAAFADVVVLVLSKEKYADLSVWTFLELMRPLRRPLLICLNKMTPDAEQAIVQSLRTRLRERTLDADVIDIVTLPYRTDIDSLSAALPERTHLCAVLGRALATVDRQQRAPGVHDLVQTHWEHWTAPVVTELAAAGAWHDAIDNAIAHALQFYQSEFLDHPQRFDTFRRAILELLHLLELPGLAGSLTRIRQVLTWPARQLFGSRHLRKLTGQTPSANDDQPAEERILNDVLEHLLTTLARDVLRQSEPQLPAAVFWQALGRRLTERQPILLQRFTAAVQQHHQDFQPEIEAAAHQLYETLQHKPALLNTLRAARVTTDAAAVALAVKTGGLGVNDLLFAPAMVALTSMLTEGAIGSYMGRVASQLKHRQYDAVSSRVFAAEVQPALQSLTTELDAVGLFGVSEREYQAAQKALENWTA